MKKRKAKAIKALLEDAFEEKGVPFSKAGYRRAKAAYELMAQRHKAKIG